MAQTFYKNLQYFDGLILKFFPKNLCGGYYLPTELKQKSSEDLIY
jgi:hypothetical protein